MSDFRVAQLERDIAQMQKTIEALSRRLGRVECREVQAAVAPPIMGFDNAAHCAPVRAVFMEK